MMVVIGRQMAERRAGHVRRAVWAAEDSTAVVARGGLRREDGDGPRERMGAWSATKWRVLQHAAA
eukprot:11159220-Heterocapsa_arctica.AAC.1